MTNGDKIRKMKDEELAKWVEQVYLGVYPAKAAKQSILEWIQEDLRCTNYDKIKSMKEEDFAVFLAEWNNPYGVSMEKISKMVEWLRQEAEWL